MHALGLWFHVDCCFAVHSARISHCMIPVDILPRLSAGCLVSGMWIVQCWPVQDFVRIIPNSIIAYSPFTSENGGWYLCRYSTGHSHPLPQGRERSRAILQIKVGTMTSPHHQPCHIIKQIAALCHTVLHSRYPPSYYWIWHRNITPLCKSSPVKHFSNWLKESSAPFRTMWHIQTLKPILSLSLLADRVYILGHHCVVKCRLPTAVPCCVSYRWSLYFEEVFASSAFLTFVMFWTLGYSCIHLF